MSMPMLLAPKHHVLQAVVNVVLDQCFLGLLDRFFDSLQLLGDIYARTAFLQHGDHAGQVPVGALESVDQRWMASMNVWF